MRLHLQNRRARRGRRHGERGVALIMVLVLLMLLTAMGTAMMLSVNSDLMINKYYRDFRGSFYAADAGLAIVRQQIYNQLDARKVFNFDPATQQPLATGVENTVVKYIQDNYGTNYTAVNRDSDTWPAKFIIDKDTANLSLTLASCTPKSSSETIVGSCGAITKGTPTSYEYVYKYQIVSYGKAAGAQKATVEETGTLRITADLASSGGTKTSFAAYGMFIDQNTICDGSSLVAGTISGPVWTNGSWTFGTNGAYEFTDQVTSVGSNFGYQFSNKCYQSAATSYKSGNSTIAPKFALPPVLGAKAAPLPDNDYNQLRAVLDGKGAPPCTDPSGATCPSATQPSKAELHADLFTVNKTAYPTTGGQGVYLPLDTSTNPPTFDGGGIYVEGNADITLALSGSTGQVYTVKNNGVTTTVTIDNAANTTSVCCDSKGKTLTVSGVPQQIDPNTGEAVRDATMLYVNGSITSLKGPGEGANNPAIQDGTALTVTASGTVTITGDIRYKTEPVTLTPDDTLIDGADKGQTLGIYTAGGDIQLNNKQSSGNLQIDASIASISAKGSGGLVNTGNSINKLTIVGGRIQNTIKNINATTRNVYFDKRYQKGLAPPWFPSTTISNDGKKEPTLSAQWYRTQWLSKSSY